MRLLVLTAAIATSTYLSILYPRCQGMEYLLPDRPGFGRKRRLSATCAALLGPRTANDPGGLHNCAVAVILVEPFQAAVLG
jgi:hypothetical protein